MFGKSGNYVFGGLALMAMLGSCGREEEPVEMVAVADVAAPPTFEEQLAATKKKGIVVYTEICAGCHGTDGVGGGPFPPLDGSEFVTGDPQRLALIIHKGVFGPIHVKGERYHLETMPSWEENLSAGRLAAIMTHVRSSWSNGDTLPPEDQLITRPQTLEWMEIAEDVSGPLRGSVYEGDEWKELVGRGEE